jgi:hypothetical protein
MITLLAPPATRDAAIVRPAFVWINADRQLRDRDRTPPAVDRGLVSSVPVLRIAGCCKSDD